MHHDPAPFWRRLLARLLDLGFAMVLAFILTVPVALVMFPFVPLVDRDWWAALGAGTCLFLAYVALETFLLVRRQGQTLGKGLMGLRVVPSSPAAASGLTLPAALSRLVVIFVPFVLISASGGSPDNTALDVLSRVGGLTLIASLVLTAIRKWSFGRAIHDYVAGTRVVLAAQRGVALREDLRMMVPGRVDMVKRL